MVSLAVTYYYDAADHPKLHTILKWAMRLLGLGAVATSTTLPEASLTAAIVLVGGHALWEALGRCVATACHGLPRLATSRKHHNPCRQRRGAVQSAAWRAVQAVRSPHTPSWVTPARLQAKHTPQGEAPPSTGGWQGEAVSPLVRRGLVLNEETGRTIQIGKATYAGLLERGYVMDSVRGVITPPASGGGRAGRPRSRLGGMD